MTKIISVINQKGGVSKSTSVFAIADILSRKGFRVLVCDMTDQSSLSFAVGADSQELPTIYNVLKKEVTAKEAIQQIGGISIIPSNSLLIDLDFIEQGCEFLLKESLKPILSDYDVLLLDSPQNLGILTLSTLITATHVLIPCHASVFSMQGLGQLQNTIDSIKDSHNCNLKILGILLTQYNARLNVCKNIREALIEAEKKTNIKVYDTYIRTAVAVLESQLQQKSLFSHNKNSVATIDYQNFVEELLVDLDMIGGE